MPKSSQSFLKIARFVIGLGSVGLLAIATACSSSPSAPKSSQESSSQPSSESAPASRPSSYSSTPASAPEPAPHRFDPSQVEPGDRILGLEVVDVEVSSFGSDAYVGTVEFRGEVTISGTYSPQTALVGTEQAVPCFFVSEASDPQLPRFKNDERNPWFCFTNPDEVVEAFGSNATEQPATIVIDSYKTVYIPSDVYNEARFVGLATP